MCECEKVLLFNVTRIIYLVWAQFISRRSQASFDLTDLMYFTFRCKVILTDTLLPFQSQVTSSLFDSKREEVAGSEGKFQN